MNASLREALCTLALLLALIAIFEGAWYALRHVPASDLLAFTYVIGTAGVICTVARKRAAGKKSTRAGVCWGVVALLSAALSLFSQLQSGRLSVQAWLLYVLAGVVLGVLAIARDRRSGRGWTEQRPEGRRESLLAGERSNG